MVLLPAAKPSDVLTGLTVSIAVPTPLAPGVTAAVPTDVLPMVKATLPATVPGVVDCTVAVSVSDPPSATVVGLATSVVVVGATPEAATLNVVTALVEAKKLVEPEKLATAVCGPPVEKVVVATATPFDKAGGLGRAVPSTVKVTVPVGDVVPEPGFTVAVSVTVAPTTGLAGVTASAVVVAVSKATVPNAVARLLASTDPSPVARSYPVPAV
jgi:hypothetical protein